MVIVNDESDLPRIANPAIRELVALRLVQLHSPDDDLDSDPVELIVLEVGDEISDIEEKIGIPILTSLFDDLPYGHDGYVPPTEYIERRHCDETGNSTFEMYVCLTDSGAGTAIFVPDEEGIDANLLLMLAEWATPACGPAMSTP